MDTTTEASNASRSEVSNPYGAASRFELETLYLSIRPQVERIVRQCGRRSGLSDEHISEIMGVVEVKLIADNYGILRRFRGGSTLTTFLTTVIRNECRDYLVRLWGKWRPSTASRRLGPVAVLFETLTRRDGYTDREAVETILCRDRDAHTEDGLEQLASELPPRSPKRSERYCMLAAKPCSSITDLVLRKEMASTRTACRRALEKAVERLDDDDRDILELRFREGLSVADIARRIGLEQRPLYGRLQRLLRRLRTDLEQAGFRREHVLPAVRAGLELEADLDVRAKLPVPVVHALVASNAR